MSVKIEVHLIRHGTVEARWKKTCYGSMDVELSEEGQRQSKTLAKQLGTRLRPHAVFHSGLSRTRFLADQIAASQPHQLRVLGDIRIQERNFGLWQGMTWDDAYADDPERFHELIDNPKGYRPPGGETTAEMQARAVDWLKDLVDDFGGSSPVQIVAVSHSGPIAALAGHALDLPASLWSPWIVGTLDMVQMYGNASGETFEWKLHRYDFSSKPPETSGT